MNKNFFLFLIIPLFFIFWVGIVSSSCDAYFGDLITPNTDSFYNNISIPLNFTIQGTNLDYCWYRVSNISGDYYTESILIDNTTISGCSIYPNYSYDTFSVPFEIPDLDWNGLNYTGYSIQLELWANDTSGCIDNFGSIFMVKHQPTIVNIQVNYSNGTAVSGANVTSHLLLNVINRSNLTDTGGNITLWEFVPFIFSANASRHYTFNTNYTFNASKEGWDTNSQVINITRNYIDIYFNMTDSIGPNIDILYPTNGSTYQNHNISLNFSAYDLGVGIDTCWRQLNDGPNQTMDCSLNSTVNTTTEGTIQGQNTLYIWANDTNGNLGSKVVHFAISTDNPAVNLNFPISLTYKNGNNLYFNFTATDSDGLSSCELWGNWTGSWHRNYTWISPTNATMNYTQLNLSEGHYKWNVWCNDTVLGSSWALINNTVTIDSTYPVINFITANNSQFNSLALTLNFNITETNNYLCSYVLKDSFGNVHNYPSNTSLNCSSSSLSVSTLSYGSFTFEIWVTDKSNNVNLSVLSFFNSDPATPSGGGGSGTIIIIGNLSWSMETESGGDRYQQNMFPGIVRTRELLFENLGTEPLTISLSCQEVSGSTAICDYVSFEYASFDLPVETGAKVPVSFSVNIPDDFEKGDYVFNIVAIDSDGNEAVLSSEVNVGTGSQFLDITTKLISSKTIGSIQIPYILIFFVLVIILAVFISFMLKKSKVSAYLGLGTIFSIILSFIILIFI